LLGKINFGITSEFLLHSFTPLESPAPPGRKRIFIKKGGEQDPSFLTRVTIVASGLLSLGKIYPLRDQRSYGVTIPPGVCIGGFLGSGVN
jgi:hypothetical protein